MILWGEFTPQAQLELTSAVQLNSQKEPKLGQSRVPPSTVLWTVFNSPFNHFLFKQTSEEMSRTDEQ